MQIITGESYVNFVATLRSVAETCGAKIKAENISIYENPKIQEILKKTTPNCDLESAAKTANQFVKDNLVKYVVARRTNNPEFARLFLRKWVEKVLEKIKKMKDLQPDNVDEKLRQCAKKFLWPAIENLVEFEKDLNTVSNNVLVKELVCMQVLQEASVPMHAVDLFAKSALSREENYVVNKHASKVTEITYPIEFRRLIKSEFVEVQLKRFPNVVKADFSNAWIDDKTFKSITHDKLEEIDLRGTKATILHLTSNQFPKLKVIHRDNVFALSENDTLSWDQLFREVEGATSIKESREALEKLLSRFASGDGAGFPSLVAVKTMLKISEHLRRSAEYQDNFNFFVKWPKALMDVWKRWNAENPVHLDAGKYITDVFVGSLVDEETFVDTTFKDQLTSTPFSTAEIAKTRILLESLKKVKWQRSSDAFKLVKAAIGPLLSSTQPKNKQQLYYLLEIFVKLQKYDSWFNESTNMNPKNPSSDLLLACGFITRDGQKEKFVHTVLGNFIPYQPKEQYLSLPKLILGGMKDSDIPPYLKNSLLVPLFLQYKGMLVDDILDPTKIKLFTSLVHGHLVGFAQTLVESLESFYIRNENEEVGLWRVRVLQALACYAGYKWIGISTNIEYEGVTGFTSISNEARQAIARLRNIIPAGLIELPNVVQGLPKISPKVLVSQQPSDEIDEALG